MTKTALVNYHAHKPHRQAFELDAGGIVGNLISPELAPTEVNVYDERGVGAATTFEGSSVGFSSFPTAVRKFDDTANWHTIYDQELTNLLTSELAAKEVVIFDHTVRVDDPDADRKPARNVHSDYCQHGAKQRIIDILGEDTAAEWNQGHFAFINIWRPVDNPINSAPLGFILPESVADEDWILLDLVYPDRKGQIMGLAANPDHEWVYMSKMTPDDVAFFNIFDNRGRASIAHSALDMIEDPNVSSIRKSIESRTLVRF